VRLSNEEYRQAVRITSAKKSTTPQAILEKLAVDKDERVREAVAENPSTPEATLEGLACDRFWWVRRAVAWRPSTPQIVLEKLARDTHSRVRTAVARHPSTPQAVLERLAGDEDANVCRIAKLQQLRVIGMNTEQTDLNVEETTTKKAWTWAKKNHRTIPCECDARSPKRCTAGGWVRCNKRLDAISRKKRELRAEHEASFSDGKRDGEPLAPGEK
jgi:hypothetical protein